MRNTLGILILIITWLCSCGPKNYSKTSKVAMDMESRIALIYDIQDASGYRYIYRDSTYAAFTGGEITIQNSGPKGGNIEPETPYTDSTGKGYYFYVGFWTRIINGTNTTLELEINFPADSFPLSSSSDSFLKLFIPTDTMTVDKLRLFNYGLTGMKSFVDANWNTATTLRKKIKSNEEHIFYTVALSHKAGGPARSEIILKDKELFYRITMGSNVPLEIPCGAIAFKNQGSNCL